MGFWFMTLYFMVSGIVVSIFFRLCCNRGPSTNMVMLGLERKKRHHSGIIMSGSEISRINRDEENVPSCVDPAVEEEAATRFGQIQMPPTIFRNMGSRLDEDFLDSPNGIHFTSRHFDEVLLVEPLQEKGPYAI